MYGRGIKVSVNTDSDFFFKYNLKSFFFSPFPAPLQSLHSPRPAGAVSASPSASWPPWLAAPIAASCGLSGSPLTPSAAGSLPEPRGNNNGTDEFVTGRTKGSRIK